MSVHNDSSIPYDTESFMISVLTSSGVALTFLHFQITNETIKITTRNGCICVCIGSFLQSLAAKKAVSINVGFRVKCVNFVSTYRYLPPPKMVKNIMFELVPLFNVRSTNRVVNSP